MVQLDELRRASRYPRFKAVLQPQRVGTMGNNLQRAVVLEHLPTGIEADDPNDAFLLAMAVAREAAYLAAGDHRAGLLQRGSIGRTRIVTPAACCAEALRQLMHVSVLTATQSGALRPPPSTQRQCRPTNSNRTSDLTLTLTLESGSR